MRGQSIYDALELVAGIAHATAPRTGLMSGATEHEIHTFAYLACTLAHWKSPQTEWGYDFHATSRAQPFAIRVAEALRLLRTNGGVVDDGPLLRISPRGLSLIDSLAGQGWAKARQPYLQAACDAALLLPTPLVLRALSREPTVARAVRSRPLLDEAASNVLAEYYEAMSTTAGSEIGLMSLTNLWLQYLLAASSADIA